MTIQNLFDRFHTSQETHNQAAVEAFRHAIQAFNRSDEPSAEYWRLMGEFESMPADSNAQRLLANAIRFQTSASVSLE